MWVEFVVGSCPCSERFSPVTLVFPSPQKPTFPNFQFYLDSDNSRESEGPEEVAEIQDRMDEAPPRGIICHC